MLKGQLYGGTDRDGGRVSASWRALILVVCLQLLSASVLLDLHGAVAQCVDEEDCGIEAVCNICELQSSVASDATVASTLEMSGAPCPQAVEPAPHTGPVGRVAIDSAAPRAPPVLLA